MGKNFKEGPDSTKGVYVNYRMVLNGRNKNHGHSIRVHENGEKKNRPLLHPYGYGHRILFLSHKEDEISATGGR